VLLSAAVPTLLCSELAAAAVALHPVVVRYDPWVALTAAARHPLRFAKFITSKPPLLADDVSVWPVYMCSTSLHMLHAAKGSSFLHNCARGAQTCELITIKLPLLAEDVSRKLIRMYVQHMLQWYVQHEDLQLNELYFLWMHRRQGASSSTKYKCCIAPKLLLLADCQAEQTYSMLQPHKFLCLHGDSRSCVVS
jgi:hypothetical protein